MQNKKILITGGAGFLGSNLARRLLNEENCNEVSLFIKPNSDLSRISDLINNKNIKNLEIIEGSLLNKSDIEKAIENKDYLFHFAWQTDLKSSMENPIKDLENDLIGLINILETCKSINSTIKIVFASTVTVIGIPENLPSNEIESENPLSIYEINKLIAEKYLKLYYKNYNLKTCILRLSNVFGEYQRTNSPNRGILNFMIGNALSEKPLTVYGKGDFIRDYCYVQNYLDAFILAGESSATDGEVFVLGSGEGKTMNEVVEKIKGIVENLTGKEVVIKHIPFPGEEHEINKRNFIADFSKFHHATGWEPKISFDDGLRRTIEFYTNRL